MNKTLKAFSFITADGICSDFSPEEHFVDKHRKELIQRVSNIKPILDGLFQEKVLLDEAYDRIRSLATSQDQMREIFLCMKAGDACKNIFLSILQENERFLISELKG